MELVKIATGEPITPEQIEADWIAAQPATVTVEQEVDGETVPVEIANHVDFRLPELTNAGLAPYGATIADPTDPPETTAGKVAEPDGYEQYAPGKWRQKWKVRNRTAAELADAKDAKKAEIRTLRWQKEIGGAVFNGVPIRTDEESRAKINGAVALFDKDATLTAVDFEAQPGVWIELDQATINALGVFVGRHVQQCFSHSKALMEAVDALSSFAALAAFAIDQDWPE